MANGKTPLHVAAYYGQVEALKTLLQLSADIQAKTADGMTPLHVAAGNGHVETLKTLMQLSADIQAKTADGMTRRTTATWRR